MTAPPAGAGGLQGRESQFGSYAYYLRYLSGGKGVWEPVGSDPHKALDEQRKREAYFQVVEAQATFQQAVGRTSPPASVATGVLLVVSAVTSDVGFEVGKLLVKMSPRKSGRLLVLPSGGTQGTQAACHRADDCREPKGRR